jgi:outer membrane protein OmpA-like peptidoglycan-associated protein
MDGHSRVVFKLFIVLSLVFTSASLSASEISFPVSQQEIVTGLEFSDKTRVENGNGYEVKDGKTYRVINDRRYRLRGLSVTTASAVIPRVAALVLFDHDSHSIKKESYPLLDEFGKALKHQLPQAIIIIAGHTDNRGATEYNQKLSEKRSQSVADYLIKTYKIDADRLLVRGFGESQPIVRNNIESIRYKNRRVEFIRIE